MCRARDELLSHPSHSPFPPISQPRLSLQIPQRFGKREVRASVRGELRSASSSSSAAAASRTMPALAAPSTTGCGKCVPGYFWVGSPWRGSCRGWVHPSIWLPPQGATGPCSAEALAGMGAVTLGCGLGTVAFWRRAAVGSASWGEAIWTIPGRCVPSISQAGCGRWDGSTCLAIFRRNVGQAGASPAIALPQPLSPARHTPQHVRAGAGAARGLCQMKRGLERLPCPRADGGERCSSGQLVKHSGDFLQKLFAMAVVHPRQMSAWSWGWGALEGCRGVPTPGAVSSHCPMLLLQRPRALYPAGVSLAARRQPRSR